MVRQVLEVKNLSYSYKKGKVILEDVSFSIDQGEYVCLLGPNGVGKSTLFKCMLGLLPGYTGQICLQGKDIRTLSPRQLARQVAYVPQQTQHTFSYTVEDVVLMGTTAGTGAFASPGEKERRAAWNAMERMGVCRLSDALFPQLSGGEKQLVLIARALAQQAKLLFMDEPTASLDYGNQIRVLEQISALTRDGYTVIQSTPQPGTGLFVCQAGVGRKRPGYFGRRGSRQSDDRGKNAGLIRHRSGRRKPVP